MLKIGDRVFHEKYGAGVIMPPAPKGGYAVYVNFDTKPIDSTKWLIVDPNELRKIEGG